MSRVVLISDFPLPYIKVGSWTTIYQNYLCEQGLVDIVVCPKPETFFSDIDYSFINETYYNKIQTHILNNRKTQVISAINRMIDLKENYIFQIVDNYGMVKILHDYLRKIQIRDSCYIQFFYHGFEPYEMANASENFYNVLDEIIVLTKDSYQRFKDKIYVLPNHFSVLNNGIDISKFNIISNELKLNLRKTLGFENSKVFIWCSQDRPKKGLHIILEAWVKVYSADKKIILLVIGCEPKSAIDGVRYLGKIENDQVAKYFQAADCYLFPTLCHEGFGMSLIEALHCGCYCIASKLGGVPEVLEYGKYGKLIENPHFVAEWVDAINEFLEGELSYPPLPKELYSTNAWNDGMNTIIEEAKIRLDTRIAK